MSAVPGAFGPGSLQGTAGAGVATNGLVKAVLMGAAIMSVLISAGIVVSLIFEAIEFLGADHHRPAVRPGLVPATRACSASRPSWPARSS